jgi:thioredoxin reductase (NADPH)
VKGEDAIEVEASQGGHYDGRAVIIATGSSYRRLGVPGEDDLIGAGIHFCATCDGPFYKGAKEVLVIGGGNSGVEEGLFLSQFAEMVRVVEHSPELKASALLQEKIRDHPQFEIPSSEERSSSTGGVLSGRTGRSRRRCTVSSRPAT